MQTFKEALEEGFRRISPYGSFTFTFGDGYELCFEKLLWDEQYYVALYKDQQLLTNKVVIKPGYEKNQD